jgi:hypothetical protein
MLYYAINSKPLSLAVNVSVKVSQVNLMCSWYAKSCKYLQFLAISVITVEVFKRSVGAQSQKSCS